MTIGPCDLCPTLIDRFRTRCYCPECAVKAYRAAKKRYAQKPKAWERERKQQRERRRAVSRKPGPNYDTLQERDMDRPTLIERLSESGKLSEHE